MTENEWLDEAKAHKAKLMVLIGNYHPVKFPILTGMRITAPTAEMVTERIRQHIRENFEGNPVRLFEQALENYDWPSAIKILNDTWFGVPESTGCWKIVGFKECVSLLDNIPE